MGLHSLTLAPSKVLPPEGTVEYYLARVVSFIDTHYEQEGPLFGYDQAASLLAEMRWAGNRVLGDLYVRGLNIRPVEAYLWNLGALEAAVADRVPRYDIKRLIADVRRSYRAAADEHEVLRSHDSASRHCRSDALDLGSARWSGCL